MARWAQKRRDTLALEERRLKAVDLLARGVRPAEVARRLAVVRMRDRPKLLRKLAGSSKLPN